jgi:hypothetical protein
MGPVTPEHKQRSVSDDEDLNEGELEQRSRYTQRRDVLQTSIASNREYEGHEADSDNEDVEVVAMPDKQRNSRTRTASPLLASGHGQQTTSAKPTEQDAHVKSDRDRHVSVAAYGARIVVDLLMLR